MVVYVPVYTHCSTCGTYSGYDTLGVAFSSIEEAKEYLRSHPNTSTMWGSGEEVITLNLISPPKKQEEPYRFPDALDYIY
jgi:hypothetical protein